MDIYYLEFEGKEYFTVAAKSTDDLFKIISSIGKELKHMQKKGKIDIIHEDNCLWSYLGRKE